MALGGGSGRGYGGAKNPFVGDGFFVQKIRIVFLTFNLLTVRMRSFRFVCGVLKKKQVVMLVAVIQCDCCSRSICLELGFKNFSFVRCKLAFFQRNKFNSDQGICIINLGKTRNIRNAHNHLRTLTPT